MRAFLQSLDEKVWQAVEIGWTKPTEALADWDNANVKGFNKGRRQSSSSQFKSQDKGKKDARDGSQYTVPT